MVILKEIETMRETGTAFVSLRFPGAPVVDTLALHVEGPAETPQYNPGSPTRYAELMWIKLTMNRYQKAISANATFCIAESSLVAMLDLRFHQLLSKVR
jgi:hypothetical protein